MTAPVSGTLVADRSAQPVVSSVEPTAALAGPTPATPRPSTSVTANSRIEGTGRLLGRRRLAFGGNNTGTFLLYKGISSGCGPCGDAAGHERGFRVTAEWRWSGSDRPEHLLGVVVVDAHHPPARALGAQSRLERRPVMGVPGRPAKLGDGRQPRERHVLDI